MTREHEFNDIDRCVHCGALRFEKLQERRRNAGQTVPQTDDRQCVTRSEPRMPEPKRRQYACEDADFIASWLKARREAPVVTPQDDDPAAHWCII